MSNRDEFDTVGDRVQMADLMGKLVLFTPTEHVEGVKTQFSGDEGRDAILTDLVVFEDGGEIIEYFDVMIFQGKLIAALKRRVQTGRQVLGVMTRGEAAKGQSAPYELAAPTDGQKQMARDYNAGRPKADTAPAPSLTKAAPAPQASTDDPWATDQN
jgi:hypothetical protein